MSSTVRALGTRIALASKPVETPVVNPVTGTATAALLPFGASGSGQETISGDALVSALPLGASASGTETISGSATVSVMVAAASATGATVSEVTGTGTVSALAVGADASGTAQVNVTGTATADVLPLGASAVGELAFIGTGSVSLLVVGAAGVGAEGFIGVGTVAALALGVAASGTVTVLTPEQPANITIRLERLTDITVEHAEETTIRLVAVPLTAITIEILDMAYNIGDVGRITGTFKTFNDATGARDLIDPTVVKLRVQPPTGSAVEYVYGTDAQVTRISACLYKGLIPLTMAGNYQFRWISTGTGAAAEPSNIIVDPDAFT